METVIFCGIQATGKTTFFTEKYFATHVRISLDLLNTRNKEQMFIETCLETQTRYVVDNTNPTKADRAPYVSAAKARKFKVICYHFQSTLSDALQRNGQRAGKQKIPDVGVKGTFKKFETPTFDEGFDELYFVEIVNDVFVVTERNNEV